MPTPSLVGGRNSTQQPMAVPAMKNPTNMSNFVRGFIKLPGAPPVPDCVDKRTMRVTVSSILILVTPGQRFHDVTSKRHFRVLDSSRVL
jgi:hypothetical protein